MRKPLLFAALLLGSYFVLPVSAQMSIARAFNAVVTINGGAAMSLEGTLFSDVTPVTSGTTQSTVYDLQTYTLPANTLAKNGAGLLITGNLVTAANANSKDVFIQFGASNVAAISATTASGANADIWAIVTRTASGAQRARGQVQFGASAVNLVFTTPAEDETGPILISISCQNNAAAATCGTSHELRVTYLPATPGS